MIPDLPDSLALSAFLPSCGSKICHSSLPVAPGQCLPAPAPLLPAPGSLPLAPWVPALGSLAPCLPTPLLPAPSSLPPSCPPAPCPCPPGSLSAPAAPGYWLLATGAPPVSVHCSGIWTVTPWRSCAAPLLQHYNTTILL